MAIGLIGFFFASAIQAAISRQRELLADASAAQFTRNPPGLAGALKKIGGLEKGSAVASGRSVEMAHLFFGSVFSGGFWRRLFRTHPDLTERILALDPAFDGVFPSVLSAQDKKELAAAEKKAEKARKRVKKAQQEIKGRFATLDGLELAALSASIGELRPEKLDGVSATLREIPAPIEPLLADFDGAQTVLFALLLDRDDAAVRRVQLETIRRSELGNAAAPEFEARVERAERLLAGLSFSVRAAVARLAVPALKSGMIDDYKRFRETAFALGDADGRRAPFEFALEASVIRELDVWFGLKSWEKGQVSNFARVVDPFRTALTYLAFRGASGDETEARRAFEAGVSALGAVAKSTGKLEPETFENRSLERFYDAVERLAQSTPRLKEKLLTAFFACVAADGRVTETEAELFDAISLALGVPAPVWRSVVDASEKAAG